jgi:hypothetical protein
MSAGHSETLSKHLTGVLCVGQKKIVLLFFFFLGHFREDIFFGEIIYLERPCLKPTPPCSAAVSWARAHCFRASGETAQQEKRLKGEGVAWRWG